jgi:hypothetical protein
LDYFEARYFASTQGRFTSPDPLMASGRASRPQTWNRYAYVLNNPLRLVDPDGLIDADPEKKRCPECEEPLEPQTTILVKSATIKVGTETIQGEVGAFGVTFELNSAQTEPVFGAQSFQGSVNLLLPVDVATMTPTTSTEDWLKSVRMRRRWLLGKFQSRQA